MVRVGGVDRVDDLLHVLGVGDAFIVSCVPEYVLESEFITSFPTSHISTPPLPLYWLTSETMLSDHSSRPLVSLM